MATAPIGLQSCSLLLPTASGLFRYFSHSGYIQQTKYDAKSCLNPVEHSCTDYEAGARFFSS